jgi:uncharacterized delta-60 repeat protein
MRTLVSVVLTAVLVVGVAQIGRSENSVVVESETVTTGATGVTIPIRITNDVSISSLFVPLVAREITPGSFITSAEISWGDRVTANVFDIRFLRQYETWSGGCVWADNFDQLGGAYPVDASPEGFMYDATALFGDELAPGSDATGSILLTVDVTDIAGTFEIDTTCNGSTRLRLNSFIPSFTKGIITIEPPREPDWVQHYDGPGHGDDQAADIEVDASGNIYVTGTSEGVSQGQCDWQCWHDTFLHSSNGDANVMDWYVRFTAHAACTLTAGRFKFKSAEDGVFPLRLRVYGNNGPIQGGRMYPDSEIEGTNMLGYVDLEETDLEPWPLWTTVDLTGLGPLVFGPGEDFFLSIGGSPEAPAFRSVNVGIDSSGMGNNRSGRWMGQYGNYMYNDETPDWGTDIELHLEAEFCYGQGTGDDYATVKYDSDGNEQWVRRYDGAYNHDDDAKALALDPLGNVYAMGTSLEDGGGSLTTLKYAPDGSEESVCIFDGYPNMINRGDDVAVDASGNVFMTGRSQDDQGHWDVVLVKYNASGDSVWTQRYDGQWHSTDEGTVVVTDAAGNIYVGGWVTHYAYTDFVTLKYAPTGTLQWDRTYNGNRNDEVVALAVDGLGNVYVTGSSGSASASTDIVVIKYDASGTALWDRRYSTAQYESPAAIVLDGDGNAYITGNYENYILTLKYSANGDLLGEHQYQRPSSIGGAGGHAIALDAAGNILVAGYCSDSIGNDDCTTLKYDSDLNLQEAWFYDGPAGMWDWGMDLAIDNAGNLFVGGYCDNTPNGNDYFVLKYESDCSCPNQGDYEPDGFITPLDLSACIDVLFGGTPDVNDGTCPSSRTDLDCDGFATPLDLSVMIDYNFAGGDPPCDPCSQ